MKIAAHICSKNGLHDASHAFHKADPHTPINDLLGFHVQYHSRVEMASKKICKIYLGCLPTNMKKHEKIQILNFFFASNLGLVAPPYVVGTFHNQSN